MTKKLTQETIKDHIIHRYENLLLDSITTSSTKDFSGNLSLDLKENDALNRSIFLKKHIDNKQTLQTPIFMEILALASIVVSGKLKKNEMVIFAAISNFELHSHHTPNALIEGHVTRLNAKNNFLKYKGSINQSNTVIATGEMTAFFTEVSHSNTPEKTPFTPPTKSIYTINKSSRHKHKEMIIADELLSANDSIITRYTYPNNHTLIKGHFPGNPLMMGVMQWMSIEDALCAYLEYSNISECCQWQCDAAIYNQHEHKIADFKGITLQSWINRPNTLNQVEITATRRINFRNMVKPNDTIYTVITNLKKL